MKKPILAILMCLISMNYCYSQLIHSKGINSLGLSCGIGSKSIIPGLSFQHYFNSVARLSLNLKYEPINFTFSDYKSFQFNPEFAFTLSKVSKNFYLNAIGGVSFGFEYADNKIYSEKKTNIFFGENFGISTEYYISNKIKIELFLEQFLFQHSIDLHADYYIGITVSKQL